ncbi:hypothetical protein EDD85DRAFT_797806 [Armillaria nabsnona]|nr:hypothetical protein EDD85DRAFT_797806 [Armillaria nabsnona]
MSSQGAPYKRTINSDNVSTTTHLSSEANFTMELDQGMSCVRGEYARSTISEDQSGVYTYVDLELIDVSTCETAPDPRSRARQWGNPSDLSNVDKTFLRGIQPTNGEGNASFETILPAKELYSAGTFTAPSIHYIGVRARFRVYNLEYLYLGDDISNALLLITVYEITPAAILTEHGGVIHDPRTTGGSNMTGDFPGGAGFDNSTSSGNDTTGSLPSGDKSGELTSSNDNSTISLLRGDLLCKCTTYTA